MPTEIIIIGAGGHAKVVTEAYVLSNSKATLRIVDEAPSKVGMKFLNNYQVESINTVTNCLGNYHIAVGNNSVRTRFFARFNIQGYIFTTIIHPDAIISPSAVIHQGSFIAARSILSSDTEIFDGCIINHGASIDHDCTIGCFTHVAPGAIICGGVNIAENCLIGAGASVLPGVSIGRNVTVGAGSVVRSDVRDNETVVGVPGRTL